MQNPEICSSGEGRADGRAPHRERRLGRWALTLLGTAGVVFALLRSLGGVGPIWHALRGLSAVALLGALALSVLALLIGVVRWQAVLAVMGFRLPFGEGLRATLAVWPLVVVTPSRSNELLRAAAIRERVPFWAGAGSVLAEKVIDLHTLLWLGAIGAALEGLTRWGAVILAAIAALWLGGFAFWHAGRRLMQIRSLRRFEGKVGQLSEAFRAIAAHPLQAVWLTMISVGVRATTVGILAVLLWGLGAGVEVTATACLAPAALLVGLLPFTLTGIGMRDAAFLWLLHHSGHAVPNAPVIAATLGYSLISTWLFAALALPLMVRTGMRRSAASGRAATQA